MSRCLRTSRRPLVESDADLQPNSYSLQKITVYETQSNFYLVGRDTARTRWRVLKVDRSERAELHIYEDPAIYTRQDCNDLLNRLADGNRSNGGFNVVTKAYGIVGFVKFLEPYYMILVTKRRLLGNIRGHAIYGIRDTVLLTVPHASVLTKVTYSQAESRYKRLFSSIDLTKDFFFSFTYRIMWSLQRNVVMGEEERMPYDDMFVWNAFLTGPIRNQLKSLHWTVALIHGFFKQVKLACGNINFTLTLIARRSRHFAGTRYLKRGVNGKGRVANDVETEQIVYEEPLGQVGQISSVVQNRGSIPLFWSQETSVLSPKPDITLDKKDPSYNATKLHFQNLSARYGAPVIVLNLVKTVEKRPRETILCREFANSVAHLNHTLPKNNRIKFMQWDFHMFSRSKSANVLEVLDSIATDVLDLIGFYCSGKVIRTHHDADPEELNNTSNGLELKDELHMKEEEANDQQAGKIIFQHGILRSNCIDCLDRTNVAQYAFGLAALGRQMHALGLCNSPRVGSDSGLAVTLMEMYENMGDVLAIQYGGSAAHNKVFSERQGKWKATIQSLEFFRSIRRHYNNAYLDGEKQDSINIFLGHFRPEVGKLALWQLDSDLHLQIRRAGDDPMNDLRKSFKRSLSAGNMADQNGNSITLPDMVSGMDHSLTKSSHVNKSLLVASSGLSKRGLTISEAEMKKSIVDNDYEGYSDVGHEEVNLRMLQSTYSLMYKSADVRGLSDCADIDWLSSSGNSCEEDAQERHSVTVTENDNWHGSGFLIPDTIEESQGYESDEYFQDLTVALLKANSTKDWEPPKNLKRARFDQRNALPMQEEQEAGSDVIRIKAGAASLGVFPKSFVDWINQGHTLCHQSHHI